MKTLLVGLLAVSLIPSLALSAMIVEGVNYKGWKCVVMKNETTEVFAAPELGGRIIQYRVNGQDWLWVNEELAGQVLPVQPKMNMDNWVNYGGDKLWPAPQGWDGSPDKWPGPGDHVLDRPWTYRILKKEGAEVQLEMTSSDRDRGGYAGVQYRRVLTLRDGSNRLEIETFMKNISRRTVNWGIWAVTQMDFSDQGEPRGRHDWNEEAYLAIPMNPNSRWPEKYHVMFGLAASWNWQPDYERNLMIVRYMNFVGKMVMDVSAGWAAMVDPHKGATYVQRFDYQPGVEYPDGGNFEVWVAGKGEFVHDNKRRAAPDDPKGRLIEMEILGPQVSLKPGQETSLKSSWEVYPGGLESVPEFNKR